MLVPEGLVLLPSDFGACRVRDRLDRPEMIPMMDEEARSNLLSAREILRDRPVGGDLVVASQVLRRLAARGFLESRSQAVIGEGDVPNREDLKAKLKGVKRS